MKEGGVIKPDRFTGQWMFVDGWPDLAGSQSVGVFPFESDVITSAVLLDFAFLVSLEGRSPGKREPIVEVAQVADSLLPEPLTHLWANSIVNAANIGDDGLPSLRGRILAIKVDLLRPFQPISSFIVQSNTMAGGIFS